MAGQHKPAGSKGATHGGGNNGGNDGGNGGSAAPIDSKAVALRAAAQMIEHRNRLAGKADDAQRAQEVLAKVGQNVDGYHDTHSKSASGLTGHWSGAAAEKFHARAKKVNASLAATSASATKGAAIVQNVSEHLTSGHKAVVGLIDEYTPKATAILDQARGVQGAGAHAALVKGVGQVVQLVRHYTAESASQVSKVNGVMTDAAKQLKSLEQAVDHDGYADPKKTQPKAPKKVHPHEPPKTHGGKDDGKDGGKNGGHHGGKTHTSATSKDIVHRAQKELGTTEHPPGSNAQKYGPTESWCSLFTTWVWRHAGVNIPQYAFTGDVYTWGQQHHLAYDSKHLDQVRPGDVLLFGTGPQNVNTSTHIGIVESVHGDTVTTIEGNAGDAVRRETHTLSSSTFYGGVHPT